MSRAESSTSVVEGKAGIVPAPSPAGQESPGRQDSPDREEAPPDRRREPRMLVSGEAEIVVRGHSSLLRGRIVNITRSGCFVQTSSHTTLSAATRAELLFLVNGRVVSIAAEIRFSTPRSGIGFRFLDGEHAMQSILDSLLGNSRLGDSRPGDSRPAAFPSASRSS